MLDQQPTIIVEPMNRRGWTVRIGEIDISYERTKLKGERYARGLGKELASLLDSNVDIVVEIRERDGAFSKRIKFMGPKKTRRKFAPIMS